MILNDLPFPLAQADTKSVKGMIGLQMTKTDKGLKLRSDGEATSPALMVLSIGIVAHDPTKYGYQRQHDRRLRNGNRRDISGN
jgi:hypothetical protein